MNKQEVITKAKRAAGIAAAELIQNGMSVGLGTGSTAFFFIQRLIERFRNEDLKIKAFSTSEQSAQQAIEGGIPFCDETVKHLDITVDGADEIDGQKRMIKGGGGALLREKILAKMSREMVVVIDPEKLVTTLGRSLLPIEVVPFACHATLHEIHNLGYEGNFRLTKEGKFYFTDNGNYIIDIKFENLCLFPEKDHARLTAIPGVMETGFFFNMAGRVIIGQFDGSVNIW